MRMIRLEAILTTARRVVSHHCTYEEPWDVKKKYDVNENSKNFVSDQLALLLMVLGESFSQIHQNIMREVGELESPVPLVPGWNNENHIGWGQPAYVIKEMRKKDWCPRHIYLLRKQLGNQAILLWNAYRSQRGNKTILHHQSDQDQCNTKSCGYIYGKSEERDFYHTAHNHLCRRESEVSQCRAFGLKGPVMSQVETILQNPNANIIPLLKLQFQDNEVIGLEVVKFEVDGTSNAENKYVTISHVWSHGYGNEVENKVWKCQLEFIAQLLDSNLGDKCTLFWMDTLLIPVQNGEHHTEKERKKMRKEAIAQIRTIFSHSHCTIVLDRGLLDMQIINSPDIAMKILASGWMRRLWTLQEAHLSRKRLLITFGGNEAPSTTRDFDKILESVKEDAGGRLDVISGRIQEQMAQSIMNEHRLAHSPASGHAPGMALIAAAWRAARWRTTSNAAHESIALATLLELQISEPGSDEADNIANASWNWPWAKTSGQQGPDEEKLQELMSEFWKTVVKNEKFQNCIPAGLIFLPGKKMTLRGFGWAPRTFLAADAIDPPDPFSILTKPTSLEIDGLIVECPGYLLHFDDEAEPNHESQIRAKIGDTIEGAGFEFPIDNGFQEWYKVTLAGFPNNGIIRTFAQRRNRLAIITSRLSPRSKPPEIGLLVEVYKSDKGILYSQIVMRVQIERTEAKSMTYQFVQPHPIFGEPLEAQKWCVDGFQIDRTKSAEPSTTPSRGMTRAFTAPLYSSRTGDGQKVERKRPWMGPFF
ncbi:hypothetical protein QQZ08_007793 [Neonectria magnoliae]|uniref:Heterokaryon incompatibility domain-containing protein n=1 Tax=Neonectria magnoliae TaxID=2732573 RepID=A0ABR1HWX0_9HYPO